MKDITKPRLATTVVPLARRRILADVPRSYLWRKHQPAEFRAETQLWTWEARAIYLALLDVMWLQRCASLPDDPVRLATLIGVPIKTFRRAWSEFVREAFEAGSDGTLYHPALLEEWRDADRRYARGQKGGLAKRDAGGES